MEVADPVSLYNQIAMPALSLPEVALLLFLSLPAAAVIGFRTGAHRRRRLLAADNKIEHVVGETTLGAILALLGLLLAFSFGNALNLAQARKAAVVGEAAAIGTAFLRADYVAEPARTALQKALLEYGRSRILPMDGSLATTEQARAFLKETLTAQEKLWPLTLEATADPMPAPLKGFVAGAMNDALDAHLYRVEHLSNPVSDVVLSMLLAAALMSLFLLGNRNGSNGRDLTWRTFVLSGFLFVVMLTIVDTQRSAEGLVRTDETALLVPVHDMELALAGRN